MKPVLEKGRVTAGQDVLATMVNQLKMLGTPPLGPEFAKIGGTFLNDSLVVHRMTAKFEKPIGGRNDVKKNASIQKMLDYDATYPELRKKFFKGEDSVSHFLSAKAWLHNVLRKYKASNEVQFPSGEGVISSGGYVDLYYKLTSTDHWTVSADCLAQAVKLAYNNRSLRRVVITRFKELAIDTPSLDGRRRWVSEARAAGKYIGFYVFNRIFRNVVIIRGYSRLTTVPKNNKEDRVISCEPTWNLIVQRSIALGILACIRQETGINVPTLQEVHRTCIADRENSTIDFSKASDSDWYRLFLMLFPDRVVKDVRTSRTGLVEFDGVYTPLNQVAPMGSGYTFEIMTITLMAYARVFDPYATVFGDDVIINKKVATRFIKTVENLGWIVNEEKSFVDGNFSESCGGFYNHTTRCHIISHDLFYPETFADIMAACNKLSNILRANQVGPLVRERLLAGYVGLLKIIPSVAYTWDKLLDGEEAQRVWVPKSIPLESFRPRTEGSQNCDLQRGNDYGKKLVFKQDSEYPILDEVGGKILACYLYHGRKTIGPRSGVLVWRSYLR